MSGELQAASAVNWVIFFIGAMGAMVLGLFCSRSLIMRRALHLLVLLALFVLPTFDISIMPNALVKGVTFSYRFTSADIAFIAFAASVVASPGRKRGISLLKWLIPGLFLLFVASISMITAFHMQFSAYEVTNIMRGLVIFVIFANAIRTKEDIFFYAMAMMGVLAYFVIDVGFNYVFHGVTSPWGGKTRGLMTTHKNGVAMYINLYAPTCLSLILLLKGHRWLRKALVVLLCGAMITLVLTDSRAGQAAFAVTFVFVMYMGLRYFRDVAGKQQMYALIAILCIAGWIYFAPHIIGRLTFGGAEDPSRLWRHLADEKALKIWSERPVTGIGINNMRIWWYIKETGAGGEEETNFTHNVYLLALAEMGLLGPLAIISVFAVPIWFGYRTARYAPSNEIACVALGLTATLIGMAAQGYYEPHFKGVEYHYFFWPHAAVISSCYLLARAERRRNAVERARAANARKLRSLESPRAAIT